ncbi:MAG: glycosyltransferase [Candidatus Margulisbacteria bacterium]|nr:glycosyltransferase [Candidatus Margulisiibacteriota bacterium]
MIEASIIIGTFNSKDLLKKTLDSLFDQTYPPDKYEIVLADSMSDDGTEEMVNSLKPPCQLTYFRQENKGKVNARNNAIKKAQGEIIILTDADIPAERNLIEEHVKAHEKYPSTAFAGQTIRLRREDLTDTELPTKFKPFQKIAWSYFLTGNLSLHRHIIMDAGLFDESFKEYGWEDIELGYRLHKMGVPLRFLPQALNHHLHPVSKKDFLTIMYKMGKSAAIFYRKHPNLQIKLYLGLNPLALGVYTLIKKHKWLYNYIERRSVNSGFFRHLLEQYNYLKGFTEVLHDRTSA